mmetsp:Transcript_170408/g.541339  ORF Transcript_170408/g.541339 Transcript_170408/m.541339 type:complete len:234 (+) Transcript_170408:134-835(+)
MEFGQVGQTKGLWSSDSTVFGVVHSYRHGNPREQKFSPKFNMETVAWSYDGAFICTSSGDKSCRIFEVATRRSTFTVVHEEWTRCSAFSHDGLRLCTGGDDSLCRIYDLTGSDLADPILVLEHSRSIRSVEFSPTDKFVLTASVDKKARIFQVVPDTPEEEEAKRQKVAAIFKEIEDRKKAAELAAQNPGKPCCHSCGTPYVNPLFCKQCGEKRVKKEGPSGGGSEVAAGAQA